jgi:putative cofactor-binding repeat protein
LADDLTYTSPGNAALTIAASDVSLDCRNHVIHGSAGAATDALGIYANDRAAISVRNCTVSGFLYGYVFHSSGSGTGILLEDDIAEGNTFVGISLHADASMIRRTSVFNTGLSSVYTAAEAIETFGSVTISNNSIMGVYAKAGSSDNAAGIYAGANAATSISGNTIRDLRPAAGGMAYGVYVDNQGAEAVSLTANDIAGPGSGWGLYCANNAAIASNNKVAGFGAALPGCSDGGGNTVTP